MNAYCTVGFSRRYVCLRVANQLLATTIGGWDGGLVDRRYASGPYLVTKLPTEMSSGSQRAQRVHTCKHETSVGLGLESGVWCTRSAECEIEKLKPQISREYPLNLSILLSGGKEINKDSSSNGE